MSTPTKPIECFFDTETRSFADAPFNDVTAVGGARYFDEGAFVHIITYTFDDGPVQCFHMFDGMRWADVPLDLRLFYVNAANTTGYGYFIAWNMGFDRLAWSLGIRNAPRLTPCMTKDAMVQAVVSGLPPSLDGAAKFVGKGQKDYEGKRLIKKFAVDTGATDKTDPDDWAAYLSYAIDDTAALRDIWRATRPLPDKEWQEYWACEQINERGMPIDTHFATRAAEVAAANIARSNKKLAKLTDGAVTKVTQAARIARWVWDNCVDHPEVLDALTKQVREDPDSEGDYIVTKLGISRDRIEQCLAYFDTVEEKYDGLTDLELAICEVLEIRQWDGSSAPAKFAKMLLQQVDGKLYGSYAANGAPQTGRFSSRGVQVHNLPNKHVGTESKDGEAEARAIEMINELEI